MKFPPLSLVALAILTCVSHAQIQNLTATLASISDLSNLTSYFGPYTGQLANLINITLLAPNNEAFTEFLNSSDAGALTTEPALVQAILEYHTLNGTYQNFTNISFISSSLQPGAYANVTSGQRVEALGGHNATFFSGLLQNATVINSTNFTGGVIHIIDRFLTLPQNVSASAVALNLTSAAGALTNLSLVDTVDNTPDLTCFIPNNKAFQAIAGNLANMTTANVTAILEYHVMTGVYYSTDLEDGTALPTLGGENATITIDRGNLYIDNARIILPNVLTRNGVIHVIDQVLNPSNTTASQGSVAFAGAVSASDAPFTSGIAIPTSVIATQASISTATSGSGSPSNSTLHAGSGSSTGAIAGGVVGGILALALIIFLVWFLKRKRSNSQHENKSATIAGSGVGRAGTTKSFHKPELEAPDSPAPVMSEFNGTIPYRKPELEASSSSANKSKTLPFPAISEIETPASQPRTELSGATIPQREQESTVQQQRQQQQTQAPIPAQQQEQEKLREQEAQEAHMAELTNQRKLAEIEYQKKMARLDHEQRIAELEISAARLRSQSRTLSELEARANPGPRGGD